LASLDHQTPDKTIAKEPDPNTLICYYLKATICDVQRNNIRMPSVRVQDIVLAACITAADTRAAIGFNVVWTKVTSLDSIEIGDKLAIETLSRLTVNCESRKQKSWR
jgi:hypothetical protein